MTTEPPSGPVIDLDVYRSTGERIGPAESLYHGESHRPAWVTVTTGLFATHRSFIPLADAAISDDRITVAFSKDHIRNAPSVEPVETRLRPEDERALNAHYGLTDREAAHPA